MNLLKDILLKGQANKRVAGGDKIEEKEGEDEDDIPELVNNKNFEDVSKSLDWTIISAFFKVEYLIYFKKLNYYFVFAYFFIHLFMFNNSKEELINGIKILINYI